jgi:hypothetical protein
MSHFAKVNLEGEVENVIVAEQEFINTLSGNWVQTSYNTIGGVHKLGGTPLRKNYAGIGFTYDPNRDAFIPPKPYPSWILNEDTCQWESPVLCPTDGRLFEWNEEELNWEERIKSL